MNAVEREIGRIAGDQDNVARVEQLLGAGLGRGAIQARLKSGRYQRLHRRVLLLGPAPPSFDARARAAAMAVGDHAAVGFAAAAALLSVRPAPDGPIDVIVSGRNASHRDGIRIHRSTLVQSEITYVKGIPVTSPARTIADLAAVQPIHQLEQLLIDARVKRCVTDRELWAVIDRAPHRPGSGVLRALLSDETEEGYSRSAAERRLRKLIRQAELPVPIYNGRLREFRPDARWERQRVIVEVDGRRYHDENPHMFESDRRRGQILAAAGYNVVHVTWRQLVNEPTAVAVRIAQALVWGERAAA